MSKNQDKVKVRKMTIARATRRACHKMIITTQAKQKRVTGKQEQ
jgi:hypothetical protein